MTFRPRPMRPSDVAECVRMIAEHPVIGPRYGKAISHLRAAWLHVLECEAKAASVLEEISGRKTKICFAGVSVFVRDEFVRELKSPPLFWFGPLLTSRISGRNSPILSPRELREANSRGGLNLLVWEGCMRPEFEQHPEMFRETMAMFLRDHAGYSWKELISSQLERWSDSNGRSTRGVCCGMRINVVIWPHQRWSRTKLSTTRTLSVSRARLTTRI